MFKILIIDPNIPFRKSLSKIINDRFPHIEILEASTGDQGLIRLKTSTPALVFIDIYLPDQNGLDLAKAIKTAYPKIIIAIFAMYDSPEYQAAAYDSGIEYMIPKDDWTGADILALVESILSDAGIAHPIKLENK
ncbi:MAG: response regulator transcription factor [Desulfobacterales bacterium]|jgi:DNA-binding NarL/FixJ family response regulator